MNRIFRTLALGLCAMSSAIDASAAPQTLTFDGIPGAVASTANNSLIDLSPAYGGLNWNGFNLSHIDLTPDSGYQTGVVSGDWAAYNAYGLPAEFFTAGEAFSLISAYVTSAWYDAQTVRFDGYRDGVLTYRWDIEITDAGPTYIQFGWQVDHVVLSKVNGQTTLGEQIVIDNLVIDTAPVPEAGAWAMMLTGLGLIGLFARRQD